MEANVTTTKNNTQTENSNNNTQGEQPRKKRQYKRRQPKQPTEGTTTAKTKKKKVAQKNESSSGSSESETETNDGDGTKGENTDDAEISLNLDSDSEGEISSFLLEDDDLSNAVPESVKTKTLFYQFTPDQSSRYEYFRRSSFQKSNIKKIMQTVSEQTINQKMTIVMSGISKVFVGEVIEVAKGVMEEWNEKGSIKPKHLREAFRRLKEDGKIPFYKTC